jgi:hypothetical protein
MALGVDASTIHAAWAIRVKVILSFPGGEAVVDIWSGWSYGRTTCKDVRDLSRKVEPGEAVLVLSVRSSLSASVYTTV